MMTPETCPKYDKCSANICPLDRDWKQRTHLKGEPVCFYLREYVKSGGKARLRGYIPREMVNRIAVALPEIKARYADIKRRLNRSAQNSPKIDALKKPRRDAA